MKILIILFVVAYILSGIFEVKKTIPKKKNKISKIKRKNKTINVIDVSKEMAIVYDYLTQNFENFCNYDEILEIKESDRLFILQWIWKRYEYHISDKKIKEKFLNYDIALMREIYIIESGRVMAFYKQLEFSERYKDSKIKPLVNISSTRLYNQGSENQYFCKTEDIPNVYSYLVQNRDDFGYTIPDFLQAPMDYFVSKCKHNYLYLWNQNEFMQYTPKELKEYCKKSKLGYPFI